MLRFLARFLGLILLAAGFVGLVIDGDALDRQRPGESSRRSARSPSGCSRSLPADRAGGDPARAPLPVGPGPAQLLPSAGLGRSGFVLGALLIWLGRKPDEPIGYLARALKPRLAAR